MKILYLTDQTYLHGGIEKVLSQKANYFADVSGDEVTIITYNQRGKAPIYAFSEKIRRIDLGINYEIGRSYFHPVNLKKIPKHRTALKNILREIQPDVVISASFGPDFYFIPALEKHIPKIKEFHATRHFTNEPSSFRDKILRTFTEKIERNYDALVLLNADEVPFYKVNNHVIIPNPTEVDERICELSKNRIVAAGRISFQKNFEDLLEIFSNVIRDFPDWEVHIYGDDYLGRRAEIEKRIAQLSLEKNFIFKGVTSDLKTTFLDYSVYAMTSVHETFPMVLLEALSVGLPIVSYDCPTGPSRIIQNNEDGYIVPYKNSIIFAEQLKRLMGDENLRKSMGLQAKKNASCYEISTVMQQWKNLFTSLVEI